MQNRYTYITVQIYFVYFVNFLYLVPKLNKMNKPESKTQTVSAKVKPSVKKKLESIAKRRDRKLSHVVNQILTSYVEN